MLEEKSFNSNSDGHDDLIQSSRRPDRPLKTAPIAFGKVIEMDSHGSIEVNTTKKKLKLPTRQIHRKHPKFVTFINEFSTKTKSISNLLVCKFIDRFFESVNNYKQIYQSVNFLINQ